jgi:hypothetical protein
VNHERDPHGSQFGRNGVGLYHGPISFPAHPGGPQSGGTSHRWTRRNSQGLRQVALHQFSHLADHGRGHILFLVVLIRGARRRLTVLVRGNILVAIMPPSRTCVIMIVLSNLRRVPCLMAVLLPLESGCVDAVPCPLLRQWRIGHRHVPVSSLQK